MDDQNKKNEQQKPEMPDATKTQETPPAVTTAETAPAAPAEAVPADASPDITPEPALQPVTPDMGYTETKSSKLVYILVGLLLVILLSLVGLFFYKQMTTVPSDAQLSPSPAQVSPTSAISPTVTPANDEEAELQQIDIPDIDEDLQQIDRDLEQL